MASMEKRNSKIINLEKKIETDTFRSIEDHSIPVDLILKNRKLFGKLKKCRVKILRLPKGKLTTKKRFNLGRIVSMKTKETELIRTGGSSRQKNKNNRTATRKEQRNLKSQSINETPSINRSRRKLATTESPPENKNVPLHNYGGKNNKNKEDEKSKFSKQQDNKKKREYSKVTSAENGPSSTKRSRKSLKEVQKTNNVQENSFDESNSKTRRRSANVNGENNSEDEKYDNKSAQREKSKRRSSSIGNGIDKSKKIFIKFSTANQPQTRKEKRNSSVFKRQKTVVSLKKLKLLNRNNMIKEFGIRFFKSYVKVKREYFDEAALPTITELIRTKRNKKNVSFSETVEVFGESDTAEETELEGERSEVNSDIELNYPETENSENEDLNKRNSPVETVDVDKFCSLKVIDTLSPNSRGRKQSNDSEFSKHPGEKESENKLIEKLEKVEIIEEITEIEENISKENDEEETPSIIEKDHSEGTRTPAKDASTTPEKDVFTSLEGIEANTLDKNQSTTSEQSEYNTPEKESTILEEQDNPKEEELIALQKESTGEGDESNIIQTAAAKKRFDSPIPGRPPIRRLTKNKILNLDSDSDSDNGHPIILNSLIITESDCAVTADTTVPTSAVDVDSDDSDTFLSSLRKGPVKSLAEETDTALLFDKLKRGEFETEKSLPPGNLISSRKSSTNSSYAGMTENLMLTDDNDTLSGNIGKTQPEVDIDEVDVFADAEDYFNDGNAKINDALKDGSGNEFLTTLSLLEDTETAKNSSEVDQ